MSKYGTPPCMGIPEKVIWLCRGNHQKAFFLGGVGGRVLAGFRLLGLGDSSLRYCPKLQTPNRQASVNKTV